MPKIPMPGADSPPVSAYWLNAVQLASASWVALLAARGYSLVEIGLAESAFHLTSLLFEIPSGVMSDVFGRKRVLLLSQACSLISALLMLLSRSLTDIMIAMIFCALGYNFASGTREALAYDSLETAGRAAEYDRYAAADMGIYRVVNACATLGAGLALTLGYRARLCFGYSAGASCVCRHTAAARYCGTASASACSPAHDSMPAREHALS